MRTIKFLAVLLVLALPACQPKLTPPPVVPMVVPAGYDLRKVDTSPSVRFDACFMSQSSQAKSVIVDGKTIWHTEFKSAEKIGAMGCVVAFEDDGWVYGVVAAHCVPPHLKASGAVLWWRVDGRDIEVVRRDAPHDLGLVRWRPKPGVTYTPATFRDGQVGEALIGVFWLSWVPPAMEAPGLSDLRTDRHVCTGRVIMQAKIWCGFSVPTRKGCSGGPLFNAAGDVVALVSGRVIGGQAYGYGPSAASIRQFLEATK